MAIICSAMVTYQRLGTCSARSCMGISKCPCMDSIFCPLRTIPKGEIAMATANKNLKATWVATVTNLDWPSASSLTITDEAARVSTQKEELTGILDDIVAMKMNAVIFQVVPCADALYASDLLPWSKYLT
ncbi:hypothetical protein ALP99_04998, partial [Pseudomonas syringae pv. tomato]